jgi:two-component system nitrate/nitrite response regulator NarL
MRILLADDHHLVREAIASYLMRAAADIVCIEASDLQQVRERLAGDNTFDLIILDYRMPGMKGLAGLDEVKEALPGTPVAILSGAMDADEAERALRLMAAGETYVPRSVVNALPGRHAARQSFDNLTPRELDCIEHLVRGSPNREIAERLAISEITVKLHLNSAFKKMGARNRSDAVRIAMLQGMSGI